MDFYGLDIFRAICLFYLVSFIWHYLTHHIRFVMIKYYTENGYVFYDWGVGYSVSLSYRLKALGIRELGTSYHQSNKPSFSWIIDVIYYFLVFAFPIYLLIISQRYLRCSDQAVSGFKKLLQDGEAGKSFSMGIFWLLFCGVFPHLWAIYFNSKRFKYYMKKF